MAERRLVYRGMWTQDPGFRMLGGRLPREGESEDEWLNRKVRIQWMWVGIVGACADDWGRLSGDPVVLMDVLMGAGRWEDTSWVREALHEFVMGGWLGSYKVGERLKLVVWPWFHHQRLRHISASRHVAPPRYLVENEAERRGIPWMSAGGVDQSGMFREKFVVYHCWNGTKRALEQAHPELL